MRQVLSFVDAMHYMSKRQYKPLWKEVVHELQELSCSVSHNNLGDAQCCVHAPPMSWELIRCNLEKIPVGIRFVGEELNVQDIQIWELIRVIARGEGKKNK